MAWAVTLKVVECGSTSTLLPGAKISWGTELLGFTDANGQFILIDPADTWEWVIVTVSKSSVQPCIDQAQNPDGHPGYISKNVDVHSNQDGKIIEVCLNTAPWPDCAGTGGSIDCFIVSATTGSPDSAEVNALRALRDRVSAKSELARQLISAFYDEYARFSPKLAAELQLDASARDVVLHLIVRPLIAWFNLAGVLGFGEPDAQIRQRRRELADACPRAFADAVLAHLTALRDGAPLSADAPAMLRELAPQIGQLRFAKWGLLEPLIRAWRSVRDGLDPDDEIAQWLSTAPLETLARLKSMDAATLKQELGVLTSFLDFHPTMRARLGERLTKA